MTPMLVAMAAVFGAIVGSFLNVVVHRHKENEPLGLFRKTRSYCPSCKAGIRWFEMRNVSNGPVTMHQQSTYQPDSTWRWMGSTAMDGFSDFVDAARAAVHSKSSAAIVTLNT